VTGGTFSRSYDGISSGHTDAQYKATVADFRLDKYEVTVGRFRRFVDAVVGGWTPPAGSGKHTHLNGGSGLLASGGGYEPGWDPAWNTNLPSVKSTWDSSSYLACHAPYGTWTPAEGANEKRPINCVNWYQTLAFCIWDGGFLASEAEWNYAAAGGTEQRAYPWSSAYPPGSAAISDANAVYCGGSCASTQNVGSKSPAGNGRYGQVDLAGNVWEWVSDYYKDPYNELLCMNCAYITASASRVIRGGSFTTASAFLRVGTRGDNAPTYRSGGVGARCARSAP
jgi:formylglycine-generating enzyme required for sulfatase activity